MVVLSTYSTNPKIVPAISSQKHSVSQESMETFSVSLMRSFAWNLNDIITGIPKP